MAVLTANEIKRKFGYEQVAPLSEGLSTVKAKEGEWFHVHPSGERAYETTFHFVDHFYEGVAVVYLSRRAFHIRPNGLPAYNQRFDDVGKFSEGLAWVMRDGELWHIHHDGSDAYDERYESCVSDFENGFAEMETLDGYAVKIRPDGTVLPYSYPHD